MRDVYIFGGSNIFNDYPSQQELRLESLDPNPIPVKLCASEKEKLKNLADQRGVGVSNLLREIIRDYAEIQPRLTELHKTLTDIFG